MKSVNGIEIYKCELLIERQLLDPPSRCLQSTVTYLTHVFNLYEGLRRYGTGILFSCKIVIKRTKIICKCFQQGVTGKLIVMPLLSNYFDVAEPERTG